MIAQHRAATCASALVVALGSATRSGTYSTAAVATSSTVQRRSRRRTIVRSNDNNNANEVITNVDGDDQSTQLASEMPSGRPGVNRPLTALERLNAMAEMPNKHEFNILMESELSVDDNSFKTMAVIHNKTSPLANIPVPREGGSLDFLLNLRPELPPLHLKDLNSDVQIPKDGAPIDQVDVKDVSAKYKKDLMKLLSQGPVAAKAELAKKKTHFKIKKRYVEGLKAIVTAFVQIEKNVIFQEKNSEVDDVMFKGEWVKDYDINAGRRLLRELKRRIRYPIPTHVQTSKDSIADVENVTVSDKKLMNPANTDAENSKEAAVSAASTAEIEVDSNVDVANVTACKDSNEENLSSTQTNLEPANASEAVSKSNIENKLEQNEVNAANAATNTNTNDSDSVTCIETSNTFKPMDHNALTEKLPADELEQRAMFYIKHLKKECTGGNKSVYRAVQLLALSDVLKLHAEAGNVEQAKVVFELMKRLNLPGVFTHNTMIMSLCKAGDINGAMAIYEDMKNTNMPLTSWTYSPLIQYYASKKNWYGAWNLYNEMRDRNVYPSAPIMSSMLLLSINMRQFTHADNIITFIRNKLYDPTQAMYVLMLKLCAKRKESEKALELMDEMAARGMKPGESELASLMEALGSRRDYYLDAFNVYEQMRESGIGKSMDTLLILMKVCANAGDVQRFELVWKEFLSACKSKQTVVLSEYRLAITHAMHCYINYFQQLKNAQKESLRYPADLKMGTIYPTEENSDDKSKSYVNESVVEAKEAPPTVAEEMVSNAVKRWLLLKEVTPDVVEKLATKKWRWFDTAEGISKKNQKTVESGTFLYSPVFQRFFQLLSMAGLDSKTYPNFYSGAKFHAAILFLYKNILLDDEVLSQMSYINIRDILDASFVEGAEWPKIAHIDADFYTKGDALDQAYRLFLKWDELCSAKETRTANEQLMYSSISKSAMIEEIRERNKRGASFMQNILKSIVRGLARKGDIARIPIFLRHMRTVNYPGYVPRLKLSDVTILDTALMSALENGNVTDTRAVLAELDTTAVETPIERYRRALRSKTVHPGWWGWDVVNGTATRRSKPEQSSSNKVTHSTPEIAIGRARKHGEHVGEVKPISQRESSQPSEFMDLIQKGMGQGT